MAGWAGVEWTEREKEPSRLLEGREGTLAAFRTRLSPLDWRRRHFFAMEWNRERKRERKRSFVTSSDALRDAASPLLSSPSESYVGEEGRDDGA